MFERSYGMANLEQQSSMATTTVMNVASLSKQFTAFATVLLADQGMISLTDDVHKYIPELPDYGYKISILNLITHTSGLKDQYDLLYLAGWGTDDVITNQDALQLIFRQKELNFGPGTRYLYSNSGYALLALLVERATGQPFPQWIQQHIFLPLRMTNSFFLTDHRQIIPRNADSYSNTVDGYQKSIIQSTTYGANGLHTTLDDLIKWTANYQKKIVGNDKVMKIIENLPDTQLRSAGNIANSLKLGYGFGEAITTYRGQKLIWHDGSDAGFRSYIGRFTDQQFSVIISGNMELIDPKNIAMQLADIYLEGILDTAIAHSTAPATKNIAPSSVEQAIEGYHLLSNDSLLYIYVIDHNIYGKFKKEAERFAIYPTSTNTFKNESNTLQLKYLKGHNGQADKVAFTINNQSISAVKILRPDLSAYQEYTGNYYCPELDVYYRIMLKEDKIVIVQPRNRYIPIKPLKADHFGGEYWWLRDLTFVRNSDHKISGFEINNGRAKHIVFNRL